MATASSPAFPPLPRLSEKMYFPTYCFPASQAADQALHFFLASSLSSGASLRCSKATSWVNTGGLLSQTPVSQPRLAAYWDCCRQASFRAWLFWVSQIREEHGKDLRESFDSESKLKTILLCWEAGAQPGDWRDCPFCPHLCGEAGLPWQDGAGYCPPSSSPKNLFSKLLIKRDKTSPLAGPLLQGGFVGPFSMSWGGRNNLVTGRNYRSWLQHRACGHTESNDNSGGVLCCARLLQAAELV